MNKVIVTGRLVADPDCKYVGEAAICNFRIAVNRDFKNKEGEYEADFFPVTAFGKTAEMVARYLAKGNQIALEARLQSRTYKAQDGSNRNVVELIAQHVEFIGGKRDNSGDAQAASSAQPAGNFADVTGDVEDDLPF